MIVENIKLHKENYIVTVGVNDYTIASEVAIKYSLRKDAEISQEKWREILRQSDIVLCKAYLYKMISRYQKTEKGYRDKLYQVGFNKNAVENAMDSAKEYGYIDDKKYCDNYIMQYKNKKGINRLKAELRQKGIDNELLSEIFAQYQSNKDVIYSLCQKFMRSKKKTLENKQKLYRHLLSKGFTYQEASKAVDKCYNDAE
ncbi:MAG: regulatory protein RecX [Clostridiales bacterium]|nr:regulatory protein RecX [Clostridiales bacterium]